jgi:biopolymer transport protein TolQ
MANVFESEFWSGNDLRSIFIEIESADADPIGIEHLFYSGFKEFTRSRQQYGTQAERIMQNVQRAMRVLHNTFCLGSILLPRTCKSLKT